MKAPKTMGLVGAGGVNRSYLARMAALLGCLGPIKGASLRVSRRIANGLKAGYGVSGYSAFEKCDLIWVAVPEETLDSIGADLAREVQVQGKMIVLCDVRRDSFQPGPLRNAGGRVATLNCVPESGETVFAGEGDRNTLLALRKALKQDGRKIVEIQPFAKTLYWSGIYLARFMPFPGLTARWKVSVPPVYRGTRPRGWCWRLAVGPFVLTRGREQMCGISMKRNGCGRESWRISIPSA